MQNGPRQVLVLARNDAREAMRVAAGLTIFGHEIVLIFMAEGLTAEDAECEQAELLELCEIVPQTTVAQMREHFALLDAAALATLIDEADVVMSL